MSDQPRRDEDYDYGLRSFLGRDEPLTPVNPTGDEIERCDNCGKPFGREDEWWLICTFDDEAETTPDGRCVTCDRVVGDPQTKATSGPRAWIAVILWIGVVFGLTAVAGWLIDERDSVVLGLLVWTPSVALAWWTTGRMRRHRR